jgi:hypothetical protein
VTFLCILRTFLGYSFTATIILTHPLVLYSCPAFSKVYIDFSKGFCHDISPMNILHLNQTPCIIFPFPSPPISCYPMTFSAIFLHRLNVFLLFILYHSLFLPFPLSFYPQTAHCYSMFYAHPPTPT